MAQTITGHFVYIVRCADGTLYSGYARDVAEREKVHNSGRGAHYTAGRRPVMVVHSECFGSKSEALKREHQLKRLTRAKKEALIAADYNTDRPLPPSPTAAEKK
jgi:putative endonuclease